MRAFFDGRVEHDRVIAGLARLGGANVEQAVADICGRDCGARGGGGDLWGCRGLG